MCAIQRCDTIYKLAENSISFEHQNCPTGRRQENGDQSAEKGVVKIEPKLGRHHNGRGARMDSNKGFLIC